MLRHSQPHIGSGVSHDLTADVRGFSLRQLTARIDGPFARHVSDHNYCDCHNRDDVCYRLDVI